MALGGSAKSARQHISLLSFKMLMRTGITVSRRRGTREGLAITGEKKALSIRGKPEVRIPLPPPASFVPAVSGSPPLQNYDDDRGPFARDQRFESPPAGSRLRTDFRGTGPPPGSGCRVCLLRCGRCRVEFAVALLDPSRADMALHRHADMVRSIVGARHVKFLPALAGSQSQDALAETRCAEFASR